MVLALIERALELGKVDAALGLIRDIRDRREVREDEESILRGNQRAAAGWLRRDWCSSTCRSESRLRAE